MPEIKKIRFRACAAILAAAGLCMAAEPPQPQTTSGTPGAVRDVFSSELLKRLNSTDTAERDAAQRELVSIGGLWQQPDLLLKLAETTQDPELRLLFKERADQLLARAAEKDAMGLPAISMNLRNANLTEAAAAFNAALDTGVFKATNVAAGAPPFTFEAKNNSFWEILKPLQQQQPFFLQDSGNGYINLTPHAQGLRYFVANGPAILFPTRINYQRSLNLQTSDAPNSNFTATLSLLVDPRVPVIRFAGINTVNAVDELAHNLLRPGQSTGGNSGAVRSNLYSQTIQLQPTEGLGSRLNLNCDARFTIQIAAIHAKIDDVEKNIDKPIILGKRQFTLKLFKVEPALLQLQMNLAPAPGEAPPAAQPDPNLGNRVGYKLIDANGKIVWNYASMDTVSNVTVRSAPDVTDSTGPYQLQLQMATKTQDINLSFELNNILIP